VTSLRAANHPQAGQPGGAADVELTVDVYFPNTVPSVQPEFKGRTAHPAGRNRLMLDWEVKVLDPQPVALDVASVLASGEVTVSRSTIDSAQSATFLTATRTLSSAFNPPIPCCSL
jgi:hypothetical protein